MAFAAVALSKLGDDPAISTTRWRPMWEARIDTTGFLAATATVLSVHATTLDGVEGYVRVTNVTTGVSSSLVGITGLGNLALPEVAVTAGDLIQIEARVQNDPAGVVFVDQAAVTYSSVSLAGTPGGAIAPVFGTLGVAPTTAETGVELGPLTCEITAGSEDLSGELEVRYDVKAPSGLTPLAGMLDQDGGWWRLNGASFINGVPNTILFGATGITLDEVGTWQVRYAATNSTGTVLSTVTDITVTAAPSVPPTVSLLAADDDFTGTMSLSFSAPPAGVKMALFLSLPGPANPAAVSPNPPVFTGWTHRKSVSPDPSGTDPYLFVYERTSDGAQTSVSGAIVASGSKAWDASIVALADAGDLAFTDVATGAGTTATPAASTSTDPVSARVIATASVYDTVTAALPAGYTELTDSSTNFGGHRIDTRPNVGSGTINDGASTLSTTTPWASVALLVPPSMASAVSLPAPPSDTGRLVRYVASTGSSGNSGTTQGSPWSFAHAIDQCATLTAGGDKVTIYQLDDIIPTSGSELDVNDWQGTTDTYGVVWRNLPATARAKITPTTGDFTPWRFINCDWYWIYGIEIDGSNRAGTVSANIENINSTHHGRFTNIASRHATAHGWKCRDTDNLDGGDNGCEYMLLEDSVIEACGRNSTFGASGVSMIFMDDLGVAAGADWTHPDGQTYSGGIVRRNQVFDNGQNVTSSGIGQPTIATDGNGIILADRVTESSFDGWFLSENNVAYGNWGRGIHSFRSHRTVARFDTAVFNAQHPRFSAAAPSTSGYGEINLANNLDNADPDGPQSLYGALAIADPTIGAVPGHTNGTTLQNTDDDPQHTTVTKHCAVDSAAGFTESNPASFTGKITGDFGLVPSTWITDGGYTAADLVPAGTEAFHNVDLTGLSEYIPPIDNLGRARPTGLTGHTLGALIPN